MAYAHSTNSQGQRHDLVTHLASVAEQAQQFASGYGAGELAYWAGLWHDLGKFHPEFQRYLLACEATPGNRHRGPDHKRTGAMLAMTRLPPLALAVQGHHGGLPARDQAKGWLGDPAYRAASNQALELAKAVLTDRLEPSTVPAWPAWANAPTTAEMLLRMVFSALVDADCLDTERHFSPERSPLRENPWRLADLWARFEEDQAHRFAGADDTAVNRVRREVYADCLAASAAEPGFFRLTVPTGGGKTRSSLAFGLRHALAHDLERIIVAIPYTSIIEQTAQVFREIFPVERVVLEHHSAVGVREGTDDAPVTPDQAWARLAEDNWDAPIVVTTNVQLFESLLGQRTGACRKLHHLARSVIVLDEAQTLPPHLLEPALDVLRELVAHYGASVVLCTATQPALDAAPGFPGLPNVREIVPDAGRHFASLARVRYEWPAASESWSWDRVAEELRSAPGQQAMAVVNTKADALALLDALGDCQALHLSALLCGAHRRAVLDEVKRRLAAGEPCLLVATQVVEAGVDLDFPSVLRAVGPLDRIVQAAGRCNREGKLPDGGRVVIFRPEEGGLPPGPYRTGTDTTQVLLRAAGSALNLHDPALYLDYFRRYYQGIDLDQKEVQRQRRAFDYPEVARRFRLIEDDGAPVVVRYPTGDAGVVDQLLGQLRQQPQRGRAIFRRLQPFVVNVRRGLLEQHASRGLATEVLPGLWEWHGKYDRVRGIGAGEPDLVSLVVAD
jgi:CRISPR-associated endonuclease/helicase Cas3